MEWDVEPCSLNQFVLELDVTKMLQVCAKKTTKFCAHDLQSLQVFDKFYAAFSVIFGDNIVRSRLLFSPLHTHIKRIYIAPKINSY